MNKEDAKKAEFDKLNKIFEKIEEPKRQLVEGLIEQAAFFKGENFELEQIIKKTGTVKVHPKYPSVQKSVVAAEEYRKNSNSYVSVIRALNNVLQKNVIEEDDGFDDWLKEQRESKE
eukprot:TRINITY_DN11695_c0_g1_i2.p5 TRINITY_DN11695_c0_g1~~TRINITY_DN11695_c0_g1_i2.p5  ORF type:complete len:117 (-),score=37.89 TRINITY_DN11695_c0_g1_i2:366-716(-)